MISCPHCREKLSEFLDQTLAPSERATVAAHLKSCAECAQIARELGNLRATLRDFAPVPAPASLRQNVRAALQNEVKTNEPKSRAPRPKFVWRPTQFAWTGTLTLAALTLMILSRPFSQAPISEAPLSNAAVSEAPTSVLTPGETPSQSPEKGSPPTNKTKNQGQTSTKTRTELAPGIKQQKMPFRARQQEAQPHAAAPALQTENSVQSLEIPRPAAPGEHRAALPRVDRSSSNSSHSNAAPATSSAQSQSPVESAPQIRRRVNSAPAPATQTSNRLLPVQPQLQPQRARPEPSPSPLRESRRVAPSPPRREAPQGAKPEALAGAPHSHILLRRDSVVGSSRAGAPRFALVLKSVPFPAATSNENALESREAAPALAPPAPMADAAKNHESDVPQRARTSAGALGSMPPVNSFRASNGAVALRPKNVPAAEVAKTRNAPTTGARRFQLQIKAPQGVKGAQVRLEVPDSLRLLWPASKVVWRGDFVAGRAVTIEFSLSGGRGGEEISAILEQKIDNAQSSPLQTQTLILPASSD